MRDAIQLVTTLGTDVIDDAIVHGTQRLADIVIEATPAGYVARHPGRDAVPLVRGDELRIPCGLGTTTATIVASPRRVLPAPPLERSVVAFMALSLAAHLTVLALAAPAHVEQHKGTPRRGIVANHFSAPAAAQAPRNTPSLDDVDRGAASMPSPELATDLAAPHAPGIVKPTAVVHADNEDDATDHTRAARHFDPCADGGCGLIATGNYDTTATGGHVGDNYALHERAPVELETSVVDCSSAGCNTVSGSDEGALRGELARHVGELDTCFDHGHADGPIAVDLQIDDNGDPHIAARDRSPVESCVVDVIAKLSFPHGARAVTLAFAHS